KTDAFALVPGGARWVVVVDGDLTCVPGHADWQPTAGTVCPGQDVCDGFGAALGRTPCLQEGREMCVGGIAGYGSTVEVHADHGLAQLSELDDQILLTGRQVDIRCVDTLTHRCDGSGAVLAAQGQEHDVGACGDRDGLVVPGVVVTRDRVAVRPAHLGARQPGQAPLDDA